MMLFSWKAAHEPCYWTNRRGRKLADESLSVEENAGEITNENVVEITDKIVARCERSMAATLLEWCVLLAIMFVFAGDTPPMVNEAHYLVKAKHFWQPDWCAADLFAASGKAHTTFYWLFGWPTKYLSLETTAWLGRSVGWSMLAIGLMRLTRSLTHRGEASVVVLLLWIAGVRYGNLAGEWVLGGIESKVPAYAFVLAALAELVRRRWNRVWVLLGLASAFHVLTGGWSVVAATFAWWWTERRRSDRQPLLTAWLCLGGLISLAGIVPSAQLMMGSDPDAAAQAARIYTYFRLPHHLLPSQFHPWWYLRHAIMVGLLIGLVFQRNRVTEPETRLLTFVGGSGLIAIGGLAIGILSPVFPDVAAQLLRYYWFRLSDAVIPLGLAFVVFQSMHDSQTRLRMVARTVFFAASLLVASSAVLRMQTLVPESFHNPVLAWDSSTRTDALSRMHQDWLAVCDWAKHSTNHDAVFLTPRHQQTFKWYSDRAEVVNWKDVPQDAVSLVEWKTRFQDVFPQRLGTTRTTIHYPSLRKLRDRYGVQFMIVDRRVTGLNLPLVRVYPMRSGDNQHYAVYELPR